MAVDGETAVGTISSPNSNDNSASFSVSGFDLNGRVSRLGLPNFVQELPLSAQEPGIAYTNPCLGQETVFDGTGTSIIDEFFWAFDDGTSAIVEDTTHLYNLVGVYNVSLRVTNRCGLDTLFVEPVEIFPIPANPTLLDAVAICNGPVTLEAWPVDTAAFSYTWSTGDTTRTIVVDTPNLVNVYITNEEGCQSEPRESFVDDTRPEVDLGTDQTICEGVAFPALDALNPGSTYLWAINGSSNGNALRTQTVDTSTPGVYTYEVTIEDILNCVATDQVEFTVANSPEFTTLGGTTSGCGATDGTIDIDVTESGSFTYSVSGPSAIGVTPLAGPLFVTTPNTLRSGGYSVSVTNTLTGCALAQVATVDDAGAGFTIDGYVPTPDCPGDGILTFNLDVAIASINYELFNSEGTTSASGSATPSPTPTFDVNDLDSGTYSITVVENISGLLCRQTLDNIILDGSPAADFTTTPQNICGTEGEINIYPIRTDPAITYTWSGPGIVGTSLGETITVSAGGTYSVTSSNGGFCEVTQTMDVVQSQAPEVEILTEGQECESAYVLFANVTNGLVGNGGYQWDNGANGSRRGINSSGSYEVLVLDQGTGCTGTATKDVEVYSELTVFAAASPNCDDNAEVFLTAYANITEDVTFTWTGPEGETLTDQDAEISISESGNYTIHVASTLSTCEADASLNVSVVPITADQLLLGERETFCSEDPANSSVDLDPGLFSTYEWTIVNDDVLLSTDRVYNTNAAGVYEVTLSNGFTCTRDVIEVLNDCLPRVHAPNAFTPSASPGFNDEFFVYPNPYVSNFEIKIFSRWGEMIYQSKDIAFRWDGTYRGELLKIDTYVYVMTFRSLLNPELGVITQRGGVALLR
ncbi:gliding motility-associated C-terminal domain-containing protein [Reichenbachiella carrageenanivorans]|uniref:Gliding motility-associated C-terminal domain-containing protein n=2 Tax=Reichenbachiella carrageenanivorans TaxID=2979869 RepID=A0ABY6D5D9_9BACT|nr:gliding motility-associated C-terminal domain-containing protein [Reichenbachiella carrageenanivorans]